MRYFGERTQRAQKEHFCDWCFEYIQPGQEYSRRIWISETGHFHIQKEHSSPGCQLFDGAGEEREEPVRISMQTMLETRTVDALVFQANGSAAVQSQTIMVARTVCVAESESDRAEVIESETDEEIPF